VAVNQGAIRAESAQHSVYTSMLRQVVRRQRENMSTVIRKQIIGLDKEMMLLRKLHLV
jgi:hypothetical protein